MEGLRFALWLIAFVVQNIGFWEFFRRKANISSVYLPGLTISVQVSILFLAGLLNLLPQATALLWAMGIACFILPIIRKQGVELVKAYQNTAFVFLAIWSFLLLTFVYGKELVHYDDYTHWGRVVCTILTKDHFPSFQEPNILFQQYPLGSAIFLYYGIRFSGNAEQWQMVFCQLYMVLAFLMPIFGKLKRNRFFGFLFACIFTNFFLLSGENVISLLVDTLLAVAGMSMISYVVEYCHGGEENKRAFFLAGAYILAFSQIKNSGIFFVLIAIGYILWQGRSDSRWRDRLLLTGCAVLGYLLWSSHCEYIFADAAHSLHAMTATNYADHILGVSADRIAVLCKIFILTSLTFRDNWLCLAGVGIFGLLVYIIEPKHISTYCRIMATACIMYLFYNFGMILMYIFSMGTEASMTMPSFYRYARTGLCAIIYCLCMEGMEILNAVDFSQGRAAAASLVLLLFLPGYRILSGIRPLLFFNEISTSVTRDRIEAALADTEIAEGATCTILLTDSDLDYCVYVATYYETNWKVRSICVESPENLENVSTDYVLVLDWDNPYIVQWAMEVCPEQVPSTLLTLH